MQRVIAELYFDPLGRLTVVDDQGERCVDAVPVRAFPMSAPDDGVSLCAAQGGEWAWVDRVSELPDGIRAVLEQALAALDFMPEVTAIHRVRSTADGVYWKVSTDRGPTEFHVRAGEDARRIGLDRILFTDVHGVRYLIPHVDRLDPRSRGWLDRFV